MLPLLFTFINQCYKHLEYFLFPTAGSLVRRSANCTFSTQYLCGYTELSKGIQRWTRRGLTEGLGPEGFDSNPLLFKALEEGMICIGVVTGLQGLMKSHSLD